MRSREAREAEYEAGYREWWARLAENEELNKADGGTQEMTNHQCPRRMST